jgi:transaldolase
MNAVEFTTELSGASVLTIPNEVAAQLPKAGRAHVIVLTDEGNDDEEWHAAAYEQFLREDPPEDAIYESLR